LEYKQAHAYRPLPEAIKRCAETMARILVQVEEREKERVGNLN
jgi:hypothetical protein